MYPRLFVIGLLLLFLYACDKPESEFSIKQIDGVKVACNNEIPRFAPEEKSIKLVEKATAQLHHVNGCP